MKKIIAALALIVMLTGCGSGERHPVTTDQCLRAQLFQQCLSIIPPGPERTVYNDWDEVVSECSRSAYYQSQKLASTVKLECRGY